MTILICILAGAGAGMGIGLAGLSAAGVIAPILSTFLDVEAYQAVGIALASDVLASAVSAYTYAKNKNIDIRNGIIIMLTVLGFTFVGSFAASLLPSSAMGNFSVILTLVMGLKFLLKPSKEKKAAETVQETTAAKKTMQSVLYGVLIGFVCGFLGIGGGMLILLVLSTFLGYDFKTALGTSVFIMAFTAFTGAVSHFVIQATMPKPEILLTCMLATMVSAKIFSGIGSRVPTKTLNRITGAFLTVLAVVVIVSKM